MADTGIKRDSKPPVNKVNRLFIEDFSGGLNSTIAPNLLNDNEGSIVTNVSLIQKGTLRPRRGRQKRYEEPFSDTRVLGLGMLYKQDGTSRLVVTSDSSVYYDEPREDFRWTTTADWLTGESSEYVSTELEEGAITSTFGNERLVSSLGEETPSPYGTADYSYGVIFTTDQRLRVYTADFIPIEAGGVYTLELYENEIAEGETERVKLIEYTHLATSSEIDEEVHARYTHEFAFLEEGKEYLLCLKCDKANGINMYTNTTTTIGEHFNYIKSVKSDAVDTVPETEATDFYFPAINISTEIMEWHEVYSSLSELNEGTFVDTQATGEESTIALSLPADNKEELIDTSTGTTSTNVVLATDEVSLSGDTWRDTGATYWNEL